MRRQLSLCDPRLVILSEREAKDPDTLGRSGIKVSK